MIELKVTGMSCQHCVHTVTEALTSLEGVSRIALVELESGRALIEGTLDPQAPAAVVEAAGYRAEPVVV